MSGLGWWMGRCVNKSYFSKKTQLPTNMKSALKSLGRLFGVELIRTSTYESLVQKVHQQKNSWRLDLDHALDGGLGDFELAVQETEAWYSQLGQDYLAYRLFGASGYFVEFGATNGVELSNSYALEQLGWTGILAEPGRKWHKALEANRACTRISKECVWHTSDEELEFMEATAGVLSTITDFASMDSHNRETEQTYLVKTISLRDLLIKNDAPSFIEFLSIDTEGSEFAILESFNWDEFTFGLIAVEHNFTDAREKIYNLLGSKGYHRILINLSKWDDWYVHESLKRET